MFFFRVSNFEVNMYYLYLTLTVCMMGVFPETAGVSPHQFINPGFGGNGLYNPRSLPAVQHPSAYWNNFQTAHETSFRSTSTFMSGIVEIYTMDGNMICSGALLKNWIVLTTAECVQGREPTDVYVKVRVNQNEDVSSFKVRVNEIKVHPKFGHEYAVKNLAILITYGEERWDAGKFILPQHEYTSYVILHSQIEPHIYEWKAQDLFDFKVDFVKAKVADDFRMCGALGAVNESAWYCVDMREDNYEFQKRDRGIPLFFWKDWEQYILGLYTGFKIGDSMPGAMYESIYPSIGWIKEQINQHPVPPQ